MNMVVLVDNNWAIGNGESMLVDIPEDKKLLSEETKGKVIITGRKTYEKLPNRFPTLDRKIIVLSKTLKKAATNVEIIDSISGVMDFLDDYNTEDVFVVGGKEIFDTFLPLCDTVHVTKVDYCYEANRYFPNLDKSDEWVLSQCSDEHTYFNICYEFAKYIKRK